MSLNRPDLTQQFLRSSAIRQTLGLVSVFVLITTVAWLATYWMVVRDTNRLVELRLKTLVDTALSAIERKESLPKTGPGQYLALVSPNETQQGSLPPGIRADEKTPGYHRLEPQKALPEIDYVLLIREAKGVRIIAAENVERIEEATDLLLKGLQFAILFSLLAASLAGLWVARRNQARLNQISTGLAEVSNGNLSTRINLRGVKDDLSLLANRIDATTAKLESAVTQIRMQSANIAHDLRTPLARLRSVLEDRHRALTEKKEPVSESVLATALQQIDQIDGTFNALLRIASIENGVQKSSFKPVDLEKLAAEAVEIFGPVVEDRGHRISVDLNQPGHILGDADMLLQLVGNLIQNALRFGADGQEISLIVEGAQLSLLDQGPGIPQTERENVLQPLYQMQQQRQGDGAGLGLALVSAICKLHDAQLSLNDGPGGRGLAVEVSFIAAPQ